MIESNACTMNVSLALALTLASVINYAHEWCHSLKPDLLTTLVPSGSVSILRHAFTSTCFYFYALLLRHAFTLTRFYFDALLLRHDITLTITVEVMSSLKRHYFDSFLENVITWTPSGVNPDCQEPPEVAADSQG
jgi:hypothetical protein